ncbi:uncharacterized protein Dwil_GK23980 [Drosophila willistoni]|uniref:VWFC domain-containing protein n=1 Tax=Drosophila willistoni TaxID=7260 RepID=B4MU52_DROWI|nr:uncharacterized protein Dwil_GK23980 [Drosophila willistoni]
MESQHTNLQMSNKKCNNNQQRGRGRRRERRLPGIDDGRGIFWSISKTISVLILCMAQLTTAVPAIESSNSASASPPIVTVAVTPSIISSNTSNSSSSSIPGGGVSSTESPLEPQQPQGQCLLDGLWVTESPTLCEKQTSCRAIQRTGYCCPDYKCDCEKDGKTYANGFKLVDPDTPCTVCHCKGGEIVCSSVSCYHRDDCLPKYVPGRCCPEYDNCPILENNPSLVDTGSELAGIGLTSTTSTLLQKPSVVPQANGFNWNITIKEITKPTEIRITDDNKAKPAIPIRKVMTTEGVPSAIVSTTASLSTTATSGFGTSLSSDTNPSQAKPLNGSLKLIASVGYGPNSNRIDQPTKPLTVTNLEPLTENDPNKVNIKREYTTEGILDAGSALAASSVFVQNGFPDSLVENPDSESELAEPETAGSDNIYHIISTTEGPAGNNLTTAETEISTENSLGSGSTTESEPTSSSSSSSPHHMDVEDDVPQVESNPAYPSLPEDDFSLRDVNFPLAELEDINEAETRDDADHRRTKLVQEKHLDGSGSGGGSGDMEVPIMATAASNLHVEKVPMVPLINSAEDLSGESRIQNISDLPLEMGSGGGSGSGEIKEKEPTTPKPIKTSLLDIDELGSGGGQGAVTAGGLDPKADAESLKLDESQEHNDGVAKTSSSSSDKISTRAEKSFVERAIPLGRLYLQRIY